ncbi:uDP-N-acetylglucosamine pyrophosphorylase [Clostridium sp. CAG:567]|jgi:UDP-N-acetylglucosamine/UDP-N-acetylgalactosamine diphosphorylase|nr:uDP-N-acetylglucosamine pyrophosphorylase [Clostridium sp. CAG:567]
MKEEAISKLKRYNQEHILKYDLNNKQQEELEKQIENIDFEQLKSLYESTKEEKCIEEKRIEHIPYTDKTKLTKEEQLSLFEIGEQIIKQGHYAVITMAGGQGTRLGHNGPKGTYALDTINGKKYIFEIIIDRLKKAEKQYNVTIPWYVMTSKENHQDTILFLEKNNYFGYNKDKIKFFKQGELPLIDTQGKIILDENAKIKEAADGNGGIYEALSKSGMLQELKQNQIEWIFISGIDNILSNFVDPILLGLTIKENNVIASKSVAKANPQEKVGVFCKMNGKPKIIEYIDLPEEMAEELDENGELMYGEVNIGTYLYNRSVLENLANAKLPYHAAFKKSGYLNANGKFIEPDEPNVFKFETFIFDAFTRYDDMTIMRVKREDEFAPVKNRTGNDSPETAVKLYNEKYK